MRLPPPSKLDLARACQYPFSSGEKWPWEPDSVHAAWGHLGHESIAWAVTHEVGLTKPAELAGQIALFAADRDIPEAKFDKAVEMVKLALADIADATVLHVEQDLYLDSATMEWRLGGEHRQAGELHGKVDIVLEENGLLRVRDWKFGRRSLMHRARDLLQVQFYGAGMLRVTGADHLRVELTYVDPDTVKTDWADFDRWDLAETEGHLRALLTSIRTTRALPTPGPWCSSMYCPIELQCPKTKAFAETLAEKVRVPSDVMDPAKITRANAGIALANLDSMRKLLDKIEEAVQAEASKLPLDLEGGKRWGKIEHPGKETMKLTPEAETILRAELGEQGYGLAVQTKTTTSKKDIGVGVSAVTGRGSVEKTKERVFQRLREAGALKRGGSYTTFDVLPEAK